MRQRPHLIGAVHDVMPASLYDEVQRARRRARELYDHGISIRFDRSFGRLGIMLHDELTETVTALSPSEALEIICGAPRAAVQA